MAIERYKKVLVNARGPGTGWMTDVVKFRIDLAWESGSQADALVAAQELLALEQSLSGPTSQPYLVALRRLADVCELTSDAQRE
jgi:hypothetical protein